MDIRDCSFTGVKWDEIAVSGVNDVARALLNLTELYKSQNINIDCLLKIEQPKIEVDLPPMTQEKVKKLSKRARK